MMILADKTALITGAARRLGAQSARTLHENGANIIIHYHHSEKEAQNLTSELNQLRPQSAVCLQADLVDIEALTSFVDAALSSFGGLDILINNASTFYPTPLGDITQQHWTDLMGSNVQAPLFLSQACYPSLKNSTGCIINMIDIHARSPLKNHTTYSCAKAAAAMLTRSLALEMGPEVRVNGIAPGVILWPQDKDAMTAYEQQKILDQIPLKHTGKPKDIADTILFLATSDYINGQIIAVDGGRQLF